MSGDQEKHDAALTNDQAPTTKQETSPAELLDKVPDEVREVIEFGMAQMMRSSERVHPLYSKITPEHIPLIIESVDRDAKLRFDDAQRQRTFMLLCFVAILAVLVFLVIQLGVSNPTLLKELFQYLVVALGGFGGGYGYSELRRKRNE